jgi:APA family basic amino acid/polyamine antiporter
MISEVKDSKYSLGSATSIVVANMIGTGIFVSLGYQLIGIKDLATIIILWIVGGIIALCGAFAYSELGATMPNSGGEYHFLSKIFHPSLGFMSGWLSSTIGFSAPIALNAILFASYFSQVFPLNKTLVAIVLILVITFVNSINHSASGRFQKIFTLLKVLIIVAFIVTGMVLGNQPVSFFPVADTLPNILSSNFVIGLVYVSFAYSGWNASAYISSEIHKPHRNVPLSIIIGTLIVMLLYVLINIVFLKIAPVEMLMVDPLKMEQKELGFITASILFGDRIGAFMSLVICLFLVSSISSMVIAGPRVIQSIASDYPIIGILGKRDSEKVPRLSMLIQALIAIAITLTGSFDTVITYTTFTMTLFSTLTVLGTIVLRKTKPNLSRPYRTFGYPLTPIIFILANCWFMYYLFLNKMDEALIGLVIILSGLILFFLVPKKKLEYTSQTEAIKDLS